ncbi:MAG: TonB family protein [Pseudomonadota bacterium]
MSIRRSSGSAELDRAAIQMIQRAAPFPPPPPGAQRSFNMPIRGG